MCVYSGALRLGSFPCLGSRPRDAWPAHCVWEIARACSRGSGSAAVLGISPPTAGRVLRPGSGPGDAMFLLSVAGIAMCVNRLPRSRAPLPDRTVSKKETFQYGHPFYKQERLGVFYKGSSTSRYRFTAGSRAGRSAPCRSFRGMVCCPRKGARVYRQMGSRLSALPAPACSATDCASTGLHVRSFLDIAADLLPRGRADNQEGLAGKDLKPFARVRAQSELGLSALTLSCVPLFLRRPGKERP